MEKKVAVDVFQSLPTVDHSYVDQLLQSELERFDHKIVVLDDDPTGIQTVHGISVYTDWTNESITQGFQEEQRLFFILTNSRGMVASESEAVHREIASHLVAVSEQLQQPFLLISRSDSTLRGHYPLETETLRRVIESASSICYDGEVILPFFREGGRFTIDNIHYVQMEEFLVPAGETEFARDRTFGYRHSHLGKWIEEKTNGLYPADQAVYITLEQLRALDLDSITEQLLQVSQFQKIVVNAADDTDVKIFVIALLRALKAGKQFLFRSAATLTKVIGGIRDKALLTREELIQEETGHGGLIIVGSHVQKTTEQLEELRTCQSLSFIELDCHLVVQPEAFQAEVARVIEQCEALLRRGKTVTVYTRRERLDLGEGMQEEELRLSLKISDAVTSIVQKLQVRPNYLVAKGGITSSEIGTKGLQVQRATVAGQIKPGVPVWMTGQESKFPGLAYVIFPGNVGTRTTLRETVELLEGEKC